MSPFHTFIHARVKPSLQPAPRGCECFLFFPPRRPSGHAASSVRQDHVSFQFEFEMRKLQVRLTAAVSIYLPVYSLRVVLSISHKFLLLCRLIFIILEWRSVFSHPCNWKIVQICFEWRLLVLASDFRPISGRKKEKISYQKIAQIQNLIPLAFCNTATQNDLFVCVCAHAVEAYSRMRGFR